jgi:phosphate transport system substrate-binding protein
VEDAGAAGLICAFAMGIANPSDAANMRGDTLLMTGSGSTFINPLFSKWFSEYNKLNPKVEINHQPLFTQ